MSETYTIEQLTALPDADLNALAAELRGAKLTGLLGKEEIDVWEFPEKPAHDNYKLQIRIADWRPATDRNQSGELLEWAAAQPMRAKFTVDFDSERGMGVEWGVRLADYCAVCDTEIPSFECDGFCACECHKQPCGTIPGNTARSETIAFCAAMLAMEGRLK